MQHLDLSMVEQGNENRSNRGVHI